MTTLAQKNGRTALIAAAVVAAMVGLAYASVPLYRIFCQVTGFGGTTQMKVGGEAPGAVGRLISVRFDANVSPALSWEFKPVDTHRRVAIGARNIALYTARNRTDRPLVGTATFNVTPTQAGQYFTKVQCFCFTEQRLEPGQEVRMPVVYYVDPAILDDPNARDISEITLSYTFYPVDQPQSGS
ncbi:cytochrome c oxidase assembly protein [Sphingosinicella sp. LHD-64]|uniref:cytochrome c oxidase assembly protein n=1 Tax=Sphingosinicella sp. LHD-64 TaxID=3072139 RepID=UPI00280F5C21|nr:cytochrome c oxidase assembly protein [Sphingosinicella sp. LHD-64]MDQ8756898.1 cytochrome c oxidase assembly protein [Sphingosinicella sp. LHD-64]